MSDTGGAPLAEAEAEDRAAAVVRELAARGLTLGLAESCTGGLVAGRITAVPGASEVFVGGVVAYANSAKERLLGVSAETLEAHGAVSAESAREMAGGARRVLGTDLAVSVTGIAGPGGGSVRKPVGTVWIGIDTGTLVRAEPFHFSGTRDIIRESAVAAVLSILWRELTRGS